MDIKDFILISGGILIALVVAHGFLIAYRGRREPYRLDIVPDLILDHVDDMERLRGELPNGGARVVRRFGEEPIAEQDSFDLDPLLEPLPTLVQVADAAQSAHEPSQAPPRFTEPESEATNTISEAVESEPQDSAPETDSVTAKVAEVELVSKRREPAPIEELPNVDQDEGLNSGEYSPELERTVEELLIVNVIARKDQPFKGYDIVRAMKAQGLRYGDMNIFHRKEPLTKVKQFSVANLVEPGTFDLSDLDTMMSPGMSFFLQLPGPEDATEAFNDMMSTAQRIAIELAGELRDEHMSVMTGQTREHMRQRIADFARRRLSIRA